MMQVQDHTVDIGNRVFCCNVNIDSNGLTISHLVEVLADSRELPVTTYFKDRVTKIVNNEFESEIEAEKAQQPFDNFCEKADNFRESKFL